MNSSNVFVISAPRSGSTWLSRALNLHPEVFCTERRLFGMYADFVKYVGIPEQRLRVTLDKYVNSLIPIYNLPSDLEARMFRRLVQAIQEVEREATGKDVLVDKITPYVNTSHTVLEGIRRYFPNAKIIILLRDGRDVTTSGVFQWMNMEPLNGQECHMSKIRKQFAESPHQHMDRFFTDDEIEEWAKTWVGPASILSDFQVSHATMVIRYEEMNSDLASVLTSLFSFLEVDNAANIVDPIRNSVSFEKMSGRQKGQSDIRSRERKGIVGDWGNYFVRRDAELFLQIAGQTLVDCGYEPNSDWVKECPNDLIGCLV